MVQFFLSIKYLIIPFLKLMFLSKVDIVVAKL